MNKKPIIITISGYENEEINYLIPGDSEVIIGYGHEISGEEFKLTDLSIKVSSQDRIKMFKEKVNK